MLTAADMKRLVKLGVTAEALSVIAEIVERHAAETPTVTREIMTPAERSRKYRQKHKSTVTPTVTAKSDDHPDSVTPSPRPPSLTLVKSEENKGFEEVSKKKDTENARDEKAAERAALFDKLWAIFPKRAGNNPKNKARLKFVTLLRHGVNTDTVTDGALRYKQFCDATGKTGTEKVQQMITWLNQAGWETDYGTSNAPTKLPVDWEPSEDTLVDLMQRGFTEAEILHELELFKTYHAARGTMMADWNAEFVNRMLKVRSYKNERRN